MQTAHTGAELVTLATLVEHPGQPAAQALAAELRNGGYLPRHHPLALGAAQRAVLADLRRQEHALAATSDQLEAGIRAWLAGYELPPAEQIAALQGMVDLTPQGRTDLADLRTHGHLPQPYQYDDLKRACYTLLTALRAEQAQAHLPTAPCAEVQAGVRRWLQAEFPHDGRTMLAALAAQTPAGQAAQRDLVESGFLPTFYQASDLPRAFASLLAEQPAAAPARPAPAPSTAASPVGEPAPGLRVITADSRRLTAYVAPGTAHLIVTSPPYNVGVPYGTHDDNLPADAYLALLRGVFAECRRVLVAGGRMAVVVPFGTGRQPWTPLAAQVAGLLSELGFTLRGQIVWDKSTTGNRTSWGSFRLPTDPALRDRTEAIIIAHTGDGKLPVPAAALQRDAKGPHTAFLPSQLFLSLTQDLWQVGPERTAHRPPGALPGRAGRAADPPLRLPRLPCRRSVRGFRHGRRRGRPTGLPGDPGRHRPRLHRTGRAAAAEWSIRMIEIDDAGWGCLIGGVVIGCYRVETAEFAAGGVRRRSSRTATLSSPTCTHARPTSARRPRSPRCAWRSWRHAG